MTTLDEMLEGLPRHRRIAIERRAERIARRVRGLQALREAQAMTQSALARKLRRKQPYISRLEKQADMYVSTLREYVQACGGQLDIVVRLPGGSCLKVEGFGELSGRPAGDKRPEVRSPRRYAPASAK